MYKGKGHFGIKKQKLHTNYFTEKNRGSANVFFCKVLIINDHEYFKKKLFFTDIQLRTSSHDS